MIKNGIKNFFVNLKHFFTPLGVFALFVIIGLSVAIPACISAVSTLADDAARICNDTSIDLNALGDGVMRSVRALDWSNPTDAMQTILSEGWLKNTFVTCVDALVVSGGETAASQIAVAAETAVSGVAAGFVALVVFAVLGIAAGYMLTKFSVRRNMAKRGLWKFILAAAVDAVLTVLLIILTVWIEAINSVSGVIAGVLSMLVLGLIALLEAYLVHGRKKVRMRQVVSIGNVLKLFCVNLIIIAVAFSFSFIVLAVANIVVGVFICLPLIEIAAIVMSLNAEAYVKDLAAQEE